MAVDAQKIVADYLREVMAPTRVVSKPPTETDHSWVQVVQQSESRNPQDPTHHLVECYFQADCYAGFTAGLPEASALASAVRDAFVHISEADHEGAVVTASEVNNGRFLLRDPDLKDKDGRDRDRIIVTASVWLHE